MGLLQVGLNRADGAYVSDPKEMETALAGSPYRLDAEQTRLNDGIAMVETDTESEALRLMEIGRVDLPSGYKMEVPSA